LREIDEAGCRITIKLSLRRSVDRSVCYSANQFALKSKAIYKSRWSHIEIFCIRSHTLRLAAILFPQFIKNMIFWIMLQLKPIFINWVKNSKDRLFYIVYYIN